MIKTLEDIKKKLEKLVKQGKEVDNTSINGDFWRERSKVNEFNNIINELESLLEEIKEIK